jgi:hypothetical protein
VDGAGYAADDDLDGIATPDLSSGSIRVSRIVALGWFMGWCATRTLVEIIGSAAAVRHAETAVRALHWMHVNVSVFSETPTKMVREGYNNIGPAARQYRAAVRMEMGVTGPCRGLTSRHIAVTVADKGWDMTDGYVLMEGLTGTAIRSAVRDLSCPQGPDPVWNSDGSGQG